MSIKKMSLLVSSGLIFFLVVSIILNTIAVNKKRLAEKIILNVKHEINPKEMVSSYNYILVEKPVLDNVSETAIEEEIDNENYNVTESTEAIYVGKMTGYGADCNGCSGVGTLSCRTMDGSKHTLSIDGEYYYDSNYGSVRIVAADLSQFPCGTIVKIDHPNLGTFYAVVLDTGGSVQKAWQNGTVWMDLAFKTETDPSIYSSTSNNTTYSVQRWGW